MNIQLSDHFNYQKILRFTLPSIAMMIFTSVYSIVDGFFVSNFVGKTPFAAVNFTIPLLMILGSIGMMFGTGGSAIIAKTLGEGDRTRAQRLFSLFVYVTAAAGVVIALVSLLVLQPILSFLGAEGVLLDNCVLYGRIQLVALPFYMQQFLFQSFFIVAEKPHLGLGVTALSGVTNMVLDALLVVVFPMGIAGASLATAASQFIGGVVPLFYFSRPNSSLLRLMSTSLDKKALLKACTNGSSELMSNISMSIVSMLYNIQLMNYAGEDGVAAYGVLMYVSMIFIAIYLGFSTGIAPVVGYHFGAGNHPELRGLLKKCLTILLFLAVVMFGLSELSARPLAGIFVGYDDDLMTLTTRGFMIFSFSFLFSGIAIYGSSFFTALNDGLTSAFISFLRSLVVQVVAVLVFPIFWGIDGVWFSIVAAELVAALMTAAFLVIKRPKYHY